MRKVLGVVIACLALLGPGTPGQAQVDLPHTVEVDYFDEDTQTTLTCVFTSTITWHIVPGTASRDVSGTGSSSCEVPYYVEVEGDLLQGSTVRDTEFDDCGAPCTAFAYVSTHKTCTTSCLGLWHEDGEHVAIATGPGIWIYDPAHCSVVGNTTTSTITCNTRATVLVQ